MALRLALAAAMVIATSYAVVSFFRRRGKKSKGQVAMFKGSPRLPPYAVPLHYNIELQPDLSAFKFDGKLAVTVDILQATSYMVLNAFDLTIPSGSVWLRCNETREARTFNPDFTLVSGFLFALNYSFKSSKCLLSGYNDFLMSLKVQNVLQ
ncbi:hypothetical protein L7F22_068435 [Adiantum nelumboides]|nr:hypothetical protein [Adiantum nelumboides]